MRLKIERAYFIVFVYETRPIFDENYDEYRNDVNFIRLYSRSHGKYKSISERKRRINENTTNAVP